MTRVINNQKPTCNFSLGASKLFKYTPSIYRKLTIDRLQIFKCMSFLTNFMSTM